MPYNPTPPPRTRPELQEIYDYLEQELQSIAREMNETLNLDLRTTYSAPDRPREGMIVQADGTSWNPGAGAGTYKYQSGAWVKFGNATHTHSLADITDDGALAALNQADVANIGPIANSRVIGRATAGSGDAEELTLSQVLDFVGSAARGDILVRGASTWARLGIGSANTFLKSDGTDPSWASAGGWTLISTNSPNGTTNADFSDIPSTYKNLIFIGDRLDVTTNGGNLIFRSFTTNGFTTGHAHSAGSLNVSGSTVTGATGGTVNSTAGASIGTSGTGSDTFFVGIIFDYTNTSRHKQAIFFSSNRTTTRNFALVHVMIETTSALANIRFNNSSNFLGGTIDLYGSMG